MILSTTGFRTTQRPDSRTHNRSAGDRPSRDTGCATDRLLVLIQIMALGLARRLERYLPSLLPSPAWLEAMSLPA
jgi:hypothetical protein